MWGGTSKLLGCGWPDLELRISTRLVALKRLLYIPNRHSPQHPIRPLPRSGET